MTIVRTRASTVRSWAMLVEALGGVRAFEHIVNTVRTGEPGIETAHGMSIFEFLARHPENAANFDAAMAERTAAFAPSVAAAYDFSRMRTVVDVGGGRGILLAAILRRHTHLRGILFEVPTVAADAEAMLTASDITDRCEVDALRPQRVFAVSVFSGAECLLSSGLGEANARYGSPLDG